MIFEDTEIIGVYKIVPKRFVDRRGNFVKIFHMDAYKAKGLEYEFKESYYTNSFKSVIRGMHFQVPPLDHAKVVYATHGVIMDVVLDIRTGSPTHGASINVELSGENGHAVYIPKGCAHGFCVLSETAVLTYMQTTAHSLEHDAGIRYDTFGMDWKIENPILSDRDKTLPEFKDFDSPFEYIK